MNNEEAYIADNPVTDTENAPMAAQILKLRHSKDFGTICYKEVNTTVTISDAQLKIEKKSQFLFKKKSEEKLIDIADISSATEKTILAFWDTVYAIIFAVLGLFQTSLFLIALVCLWCAYGKEIRILTASGETIRIPVNPVGSKEARETLLKICNHM